VGLVIGGWDLDAGEYTAAVDVIGGDCTIPDLPGSRFGSVSFLTAGPEDPRLMVCGGDTQTPQDTTLGLKRALSSCLQYKPALEPPTWIVHSSLRTSRSYASAVTLTAGVYVLGGQYSSIIPKPRSTSEILRPGSSMWEEGPVLPGGEGLVFSCAVAISNTTFLLIGGMHFSGFNDSSTSRLVYEFSSLTGAWTQWLEGLSVHRAGHACSSYQGKMVVAGGWNGGYGDNGGWLDSTDILDPETRQVRPGGNGHSAAMATPRVSFGIYEIGYAGSRILMTFGSRGPNSTATEREDREESLLQEWDTAAEVWKAAPAVMSRRYAFAAVTVEARHVCPQGELLACSKV
jgi:hypothetical protein